MVLYSAIQSGYYFMSIIAIIVSVISASYYLKIIKVLFTENDVSNFNFIEKEANLANSNLKAPYYPISKNIPFVDVHDNYFISYYITNFHSFLISILTLVILFFILKPSLLLNSTQLLSLSLFYC